MFLWCELILWASWCISSTLTLSEQNLGKLTKHFHKPQSTTFPNAAKSIYDAEITYITGLNDILNILENSNFLIILTNFRGKTFSHLSNPIILRSLRLAKLPYYDTRDYFVLNEIAKSKLNLAVEHYCQHSLLHGSQFWITQKWETYHPILNVPRFSMKARPGHNIVSILLFPYTHSDAANLDDIYMEFQISKNAFPTTVAPFKVLVMSRMANRANVQLKNLVLLIRRHVNSYTRLYIAKTALLRVADLGHQILLENLHIIQVCRGNPGTYLNIVPFRTFSDLSKSYEIISLGLCQGNPFWNKLLYYSIPPSAEATEVIRATWDMVTSCEKYETFTVKFTSEVKRLLLVMQVSGYRSWETFHLWTITEIAFATKGCA